VRSVLSHELEDSRNGSHKCSKVACLTLVIAISVAPIIILTIGYQLYRPKITVSAISTKQIVMRLPLSFALEDGDDSARECK